MDLNLLVLGILLSSYQGVSDSATPWTQLTRLPCPLVSPSLLQLMSTEAVMILANHLILCCPFLLLPSVFPSIRVFSSESALGIRWPKFWSFSISPSNGILT